MAGKKKTSARSSSSANSLSGEELVRLLRQYASEEQRLQPFTRADLEKIGLRMPLIIIGAESYRLRRLVSVIHETLFASDPSSLGSYFPDDLSSPRIIEDLKREALGGSLFSRNKLVALYECGGIKQSSGEKLLPIFEIDPSNVFFVLLTTQPEKQNKWLESAISMGTTVTITALKGPILKKWIEKELSRQGHLGGISPDALDILAQAFQEDAGRLASEISKLALMLDPEATVKASDLKMLQLGSADANTFALLETTSQRRVARAYRTFENLSEQGIHPLQILALLSKSVRSMLANRDQVKLHSDLSNPWILRNLAQAQRNFSARELRAALTLLAQLDLQLKGSKREPGEIMRDLLVALSTRQAPTSSVSA